MASPCEGLSAGGASRGDGGGRRHWGARAGSDGRRVPGVTQVQVPGGGGGGAAGGFGGRAAVVTAATSTVLLLLVVGGAAASASTATATATADPTREELLAQHSEFDPATLLDGVFERAYAARAVHTLPVVVVASSFGWPPLKPLDWLAKQPWPVFVSTKQPGHGVHSEPWGNRGREVSSFLKFLVDFYDDLPERMVFSHGHDRAWHQQGYEMQYLLRNLCFDKYQRYASLNTQPAESAGKWAVNLLLSRNTPITNFAKAELNMSTAHPKELYDRCCSQFLVSREAVRARPKSLYQTYLNMVLNGTSDTDSLLKDVHLSEEMWHHMFGVPDLVQAEQYGNTLDTNNENGMPLVYNPIYSLEKVASCPNQLCADPATPCGRAVAESKRNPVGWHVPGWSKRDEVHKKHLAHAKQVYPKGVLKTIDSDASSNKADKTKAAPKKKGEPSKRGKNVANVGRHTRPAKPSSPSLRRNKQQPAKLSAFKPTK